MDAKCMLDGCDAFVQRQYVPHIARREEQDVAGIHATSPATDDHRTSNSCRLLPQETSTGSMPRQKIRTECGPFSISASFSTRRMEPSRRPTTSSSFSSRN